MACNCKACKAAKLNPAPEASQYALYAKHKARGTSPGNPKWYKPQTLLAPFRFKPGMPPVYPRLPTGAQWNATYSTFSGSPTVRYK